MELSSEPSKDEDVILLRQLYRAGKTHPVGVPTPGSATKAGEAKPASRRKRVRVALAVIAWLLLLGGTSYYFCLPNLDEVSRNLKAIREDLNLTMEQRFEKSHEIFSKLTPEQGKQVVQTDMKKLAYKRNAEMHKFLKMTLEEQLAYLKKQEEEWRQLHRQGGPGGGSGPKGGNGAAVFIGGSGVAMSVGRGRVVQGGSGVPGVGRFVFFGPAGGGPPNPGQMQKTMLDNISPETRAGMYYQRGLSK